MFVQSISIILGALPTFRLQISSLNIAESRKSCLVWCLEDVMRKATYAWHNYSSITNENLLLNDLIEAWDGLKEHLQNALPEEDTPDIANIFYTLESLETGFSGLAAVLMLNTEEPT